MDNLTQIEKDFADGYYATKMRFFLAGVEKRIDESDVELRVMTMVEQFMNLTKAIKEGKL